MARINFVHLESTAGENGEVICPELYGAYAEVIHLALMAKPESQGF